MSNTPSLPPGEDLYWRLHSLSKILEGSGFIDESQHPEAYSTILDAMAFVRGTPQPVVREPLMPIRQAAFDLYVPPFRQEYGYIRDANNHMVADDAGSEGAGTIAARIRGWGRIQYMDKPELRAEALQDEVGNIVVEALNAYWAAHGLTQKGGSDVPSA